MEEMNGSSSDLHVILKDVNVEKKMLSGLFLLSVFSFPKQSVFFRDSTKTQQHKISHGYIGWDFYLSCCHGWPGVEKTPPGSSEIFPFWGCFE